MSIIEIVFLVLGTLAAVIGLVAVSVIVRRTLNVEDDCVVNDDVTESPVFPLSLIALKQEERCEDLELTTTASSQ